MTLRDTQTDHDSREKPALLIHPEGPVTASQPHARFADAPQGTSTMRLLRIRQVMQVTGLSRMTIYRLERAGNFPQRRRLGMNSVAWLEGDVSQWVDSRPLACAQPERIEKLPARRNA